MPRSAPVDGFELAYERHGAGSPVVLLHGWPGLRADHDRLVPLLEDAADLIVPDLRGFGGSTGPADDPTAFGAEGQARSVLGLLDDLGIESAVLGGYDVGSRVAQTIARTAPDRVRALVLAPPLPGVGERVLQPEAVARFWYQSFHDLDLATALLDGRPDAVEAYLRHFWSTWSGPAFELDDDRLAMLVAAYSRPGAFEASIGWYRAGSGTVAQSAAESAPAQEDRIAAPTTVLWPPHDPLFPPAWSDRLEAFFADVTVRRLESSGHFSPLEDPEAWAGAIRAAVGD